MKNSINKNDLLDLELEYGSISDLSERIIHGDVRSLSRCITLSESSRRDHQYFSRLVLEKILPETGKSLRIGISGPPGVGKSTFIESFGTLVLDKGKSIAVLAVDPSSSKSGGSILGDKTRMEKLSQSAKVYIRPSPAGNTLGGVGRHTREAVLLCEAAGYDIVIVETVGVGQSESKVSNIIDIFLLLISPGGGDELQGIKRGIVEMADLIIVNKADGQLKNEAQKISEEYSSAVKLFRPKGNNWNTRVLTCSAIKNTGINNIWNNITEFRDFLGDDISDQAHRKQQFLEWMKEEIIENLSKEIYSDTEIVDMFHYYEEKILIGEVLPSVAAYEIVNNFLKK